MQLKEILKELLGSNLEEFKIVENLEEFILTFTTQHIDFFTVSSLEELMGISSERDKVELSIEYTEDHCYWYNNDNVLKDSESDLEEIKCLFDKEDDKVKVKLVVKKEVVEGKLSIYSYAKVEEWLISKDIEGFLKYSSIFKSSKGSGVICDCLYDDVQIYSGLYIFISSNTQFKRTDIYDAYDITEKRKLISNFKNIPEDIVPNDFRIFKTSNNTELVDLLNCACLFLALCFISDQATITHSEVKLLINGYRQIKTHIEHRVPAVQNDSIYDIYLWLYGEGNISDKSYIARSIISLHCKYEEIITVDKTVYASIISNYRLYLKGNVKDFLKLKKEVTTALQEYTKYIAQSIDKISSSLKTNFIAAFGYLITLTLKDIINYESTISNNVINVGAFLLLCSLVSYGVTFYESNQKKLFYDSLINELKNHYNCVLEDSILVETFDNNLSRKAVDDNYKRSCKLIKFIWLGSLLVATIFLASIKFLTPP